MEPFSQLQPYICCGDMQDHAVEPAKLISSFDKMAAILSDDIFKCIFMNEKSRVLIRISLKFFCCCS